MKPRPYPLTFQPIFKERVWGGRQLEQLYGKKLPPGKPIGESWEISDRPGDTSLVDNGPWTGKDLHWLLESYGQDLLGPVQPAGDRFPLLIKLLDAREKLSLQVHPPAHQAAALHGEPKTEMWYIADAEPGAELYVGLRRGITRADFENCIRTGGVEDCFHRVPVKAGDTMFLPSGRVHAIGAGLVIFEIQQNSDTTYRVFDWNRVGLDGKPRELHVPQSLASIDFADFEPALVAAAPFTEQGITLRRLVEHELFTVEWMNAESGGSMHWVGGRMQILGLVAGSVLVTSDSEVPEVRLQAGGFCLLPASLSSAQITFSSGAQWLRITAGGNDES